jgi:hypothetical protein
MVAISPQFSFVTPVRTPASEQGWREYAASIDFLDAANSAVR